jgi:hypothetical protein
MGEIEQIKRLEIDRFGKFLPSYSALHNRCVGIRTNDPFRCAHEAQSRGIGAVNIYLAGDESVVCWPLVPAL